MDSKGIATLLAINIFLVFAAISLVIFVYLFTYTITVAREQTITLSQNSLIPLAIVNSRYYLNNDNLAVALVKDEVQTSTELEETMNKLASSTCYKFLLGGIKNDRDHVISGGHDVSCNSKRNFVTGKYNFRTTFVFPQIYDGRNFVIPGEFSTYD